MPRTALGNNSQLYTAAAHGMDANFVLDQITNRINKLEVAFTSANNDDDHQTSFLGGHSPSKSMNHQQNKSILNRIRKIEEQMYELENQIKENEIDIQQVKQTVNSTSSHHHRSSSRGRSADSPPPEKIIQLVESTKERGNQHTEEIKEIERRIKKLADSTTKACRSLSTGLTDVQQATLNLYSWTDKVHDAFETVAEKVDLPSNLCPRAKVSHSKSQRFYPF
jgi:chromosome segregation ATPase